MKNSLSCFFRLKYWAIGFTVFVQNISFASSHALGPVYPIVEPNLLEMLQRHAQDSAQHSHSQYRIAQERIKNWSTRPIGQTLAQAQSLKINKKNIDIQFQRLLDDDFRRYWLFIDADRNDEVQLAKTFLKLCPQPFVCRVILVSGHLKHTQERLKTRLWFDQGSRLTHQLGVTTLPSLASFSAKQILTVTAPSKRFPLKEFLK